MHEGIFTVGDHQTQLNKGVTVEIIYQIFSIRAWSWGENGDFFHVVKLAESAENVPDLLEKGRSPPKGLHQHAVLQIIANIFWWLKYKFVTLRLNFKLL